MRLSPDQVDTIRRVVREEAGTDMTIRLFGSRVDDSVRGGDIDLLLQSAHPIGSPALLSARISARLIRALGGRRVDVVLGAPNLEILPIHEVAEAEGVLL